MRYFAELAYNGARYKGWQRQPQAPSVQQTIEETLSLLLRTPVAVTGCGRTDAGVHASQYFLHFDFEGIFPRNFLSRLNKVLPPDISFYRIFEVSEEAHARYSAIRRSYTYFLTFRKDPFRQETATFYPYPQQPAFERMQAAAQLLLNYSDFTPFCRSNTDALTRRCAISRAEWVAAADNEWQFHISSDRFLRGMVRLIVGMCLNVGRDRLSLEEVKTAMEEQRLLNRAESAPPEGLFLSEIVYPEEIMPS